MLKSSPFLSEEIFDNKTIFRAKVGSFYEIKIFPK